LGDCASPDDEIRKPVPLRIGQGPTGKMVAEQASARDKKNRAARIDAREAYRIGIETNFMFNKIYHSYPLEIGKNLTIAPRVPGDFSVTRITVGSNSQQSGGHSAFHPSDGCKPRNIPSYLRWRS
jgi:hypothetical protein